ncbi:uncharacterized protein [Eurosta solidaginis]|uniref:uncharacterized protein n=1 Tax=Eurosta solidaginis TaxID=178769 RepID=UPI003530FAC2
MKDFYKHMRYKYDEHTCITLKHFSKLTQKLSKQMERLKFLLECKRYDIIPNHLMNAVEKVKITTTSQKLQQQLHKTKFHFLRKVMNMEITQTNLDIKITKDYIYHAEKQLERNLNEGELKTFKNKQNFYGQRVAKEVNEVHTTKINNLKAQQLRNMGICTNNDWFVNKTDINFPEEVKWLLSLGKKFTLPTTRKHFSAIHTISEIEQAIQALGDENTKEMARNKVSNRILQFKRNIKNKSLEKFILETYNKCKAFLNLHKNNIVITDADKGNKTVVIYKRDYKEKMEELLEHKNTYRKLRTDRTNALQKKNNRIVNDLYKQKYINIKEKHKLTCSAAIAPKLYGLPKIHKPNTPLRPIASSVNVPCYQLSKHIGDIIKNITSEEYNIKNMFRLKERLQNMIIDKEEALVSFDVVSLFTNIPTNLAIRIIMEKFDKINSLTNIPKCKFQEILRFCLLDNNYFIYDNDIYAQTFGMPMGNPLSPTIADIILDDLIDKTLNELKQKHDIDIKFLVKYVDDILAIVKRKDVDLILETLNKYHNKIQFTIEMERDDSIPYLDVRIYKNINNGSLSFEWYAKPLSSGRLINFHSSQPMKYKINTAKNLIKKVLTISDKQFWNTNLQKIDKMLKSNSYPHTLIKNLIE